MREESERADAIVEAHQHDAALGELSSVIDGDGRGTFVEPSAIEIGHDGPTVGGSACGGPDIYIEAIFAGHALLHEGLRPRQARMLNILYAGAAEMIGFAYAFPFRGGLRCAPAEVVDWRRGERNALIRGNAVGVCDAGDLAGFDANGYRRGGVRAKQHSDDHGGAENE